MGMKTDHQFMDEVRRILESTEEFDLSGINSRVVDVAGADTKTAFTVFMVGWREEQDMSSDYSVEEVVPDLLRTLDLRIQIFVRMADAESRSARLHRLIGMVANKVSGKSILGETIPGRTRIIEARFSEPTADDQSTVDLTYRLGILETDDDRSESEGDDE
jgi:hypothetical protein